MAGVEMQDELMTTTEICEWLKITRGTAWKWRKAGMPYIGRGKGIRYEKDSVRQWLEKAKKN